MLAILQMQPDVVDVGIEGFAPKLRRDAAESRTDYYFYCLYHCFKCDVWFIYFLYYNIFGAGKMHKSHRYIFLEFFPVIEERLTYSPH